MRIDSFIFNWLDYAPAAEQLERALQPLSTAVYVINSGPPRPGWVNLTAEDYFTAKWHAALNRFNSQILFNIQADVTVPDVAALFASAEAAFQSGDVGVYAPDVSFTNWAFDPGLLPRYADGLHAIPLPDTLCWFLGGNVVRNTRYPSPEANRYGWGMDVVSLATSLKMGLRVVRDYGHRVIHPKGSGYATPRAEEELLALLRDDPASAFVFHSAFAIRLRHQGKRG